jgi:hypothetical protein
MELLVLCPFWDMSISLRRPLWDKSCLPRAYFETCPLSYNNHYETWPFWDMTFFLQQPLWDMTILRHDIFSTSTIMRHDHFETWHFSYINHYETWLFWDMFFWNYHYILRALKTSRSCSIRQTYVFQSRMTQGIQKWVQNNYFWHQESTKGPMSGVSKTKSSAWFFCTVFNIFVIFKQILEFLQSNF